jgi:hypothetical protein
MYNGSCASVPWKPRPRQARLDRPKEAPKLRAVVTTRIKGATMARSSSAMMIRMTSSTSGISSRVSRCAAWEMSYSMAGPPPTRAPGAARARFWRRALIALPPAVLYGETDKMTVPES